MTFNEFAEKVLGIELLDWQKVVLEYAQKCKDEGKSICIHTDARAGKMLLNNVIQQKLGYDRGFEDGIMQGKADQKKDDNEFFNFEAAWELEKKKIKQDGVKEFAEWLLQHFDLRFSSNPDVWLDEFFNHTTDKALVEWKKENEDKLNSELITGGKHDE